MDGSAHQYEEASGEVRQNNQGDPAGSLFILNRGYVRISVINPVAPLPHYHCAALAVCHSERQGCGKSPG